MTSNLPATIKVSADVSVYGVVLVGWLGLLQPWLTALATITAIIWTSIQIYDYYKRKKANGQN